MNPKFENTGILSRNERRDSDKSPEFKGTAQVNGVEYWLNAWVNEKDGRKFFKLKFNPKDERQKPQYQEDPHTSPPEGDVPF
jgi:hypothetical protein